MLSMSTEYNQDCSFFKISGKQDDGKRNVISENHYD